MSQGFSFGFGDDDISEVGEEDPSQTEVVMEMDEEVNSDAPYLLEMDTMVGSLSSALRMSLLQICFFQAPTDALSVHRL